MKSSLNRSRRNFQLLSVLASLLLITPAWSKDHGAKAAQGPVHVIAQMHLPGNASDMTLHQNGGKSYLYMQLGSTPGVLVVDVTNPEKLKTVSTIPTQAPEVGMSISGNLALVGVSQQRGASPSQANLTLWDISTPGKPRLVQQFSGVARILADDRGFIYVLNSAGLSVLVDPEQNQEPQSSVEYGG